MATFPALNVWTDAWLADTAHLGRVDRDIYFHLLILMWRTPKCRVPNDMEWIERKLRCAEGEKEILKAVIREFCQSTGNWITQKRLTKEYLAALRRSKFSSDKAKLRWNKEKDLCRGNATTTTTTTTTINTNTPFSPPTGGEEGKERNSGNGRRRQGYSTRESFAQAVAHVKARDIGRGDESSPDDPELLPRLREGRA